MADEKVTARGQAEDDYMFGMSYAGLAEKYGVSINTIKSWKQRYSWSRNGKPAKPPKPPKRRTQKAKVQPKPKPNAKAKGAHKDAPPERPEPDDEGDELSLRETMFSEIYVTCFNATQAARMCGYSEKNTSSIACHIMSRPRVRKYIKQLKAWKLETLLVGPEDIVERYIRIAFGDIGQYLQFGHRETPVLDGYGTPLMRTDENGQRVPVMQVVNYVDVNQAAEVDTTLIAEMSQGRDGAVKIKMANSMEALEWLRGYFELNPMDKHKKTYDMARLALEEKDKQTAAVTVVINDDYGDG